MWPPRDRIHLGLDLKGGIHLVMQVVHRRRSRPSPATQVQSGPRAGQPQRASSSGGIQLVDRHRPSRVEGVEPARVKDMRAPAEDFFRHGLGHPRAGRGALPGQDDRRLRAARCASGRCRRRCARWSGASTSWAWPEPIIASHGETGRPDPAAAARRHRRGAGQDGDPDDGPALAQAGRGPVERAGGAAAETARRGARQHGGRAGPGRHARPARLLPGEPRVGRSRAATSRTPA